MNREKKHAGETSCLSEQDPSRTRLIESAKTVLSSFFESDLGCRSSVIVIDVNHRLCFRYDGDRSLDYVLNSTGMLIGSDVCESRLGTNGGDLCLLLGTPTVVLGLEHWNDELSAIAEAASPIRDSDGSISGSVVVINHLLDHSPLAITVSKFLAQQVQALIADADHRRTAALARCLVTKTLIGDNLVLATDGTCLFTNTSTLHRTISGRDLEGMVSRARSALINGVFEACRITLQSGAHAAVDTEPVFHLGEVTGCVLTATVMPSGCESDDADPSQRQGAHIGRVGPRDYTVNLTGEVRRQQRRERNQALLNPYLRAREVVATNIAERRNHLLVGEPGTGKTTMVAAMYAAQHPGAGIEIVSCIRRDVSIAVDRWSTSVLDHEPRRLLVLRSLNHLDISEARALNRVLTALSESTDPPVVVGCVDTSAIDPTRPYALLGKHFHEVARIPALRHRVDDIADIARSILREISTRHSLRLGVQVVRVFEGYSWPGNISELKDVLRHVVANKPFGEIQPLDLPRLHFRDPTRKLSPLDTAQCDTIIQALYEVGGNRYEAAALLGISRSSLYRKIDAFGISYIG